ncbi:MAG: AAA family ATPase [Acidimicrobiales bacterium]
MTSSDPELEAEQAHLDRAHVRLEQSRSEALSMQSMVEVGQGGTNQARYEREVILGKVATRLAHLDIGERSLAFGRIDLDSEAGGGSFHIGRIAISDHDQTPLIVDWRAPIAEAFYRATGRDAQGLVRRRHFISRGRKLLGLEDEFFGESAGQSVATVDGRELRGKARWWPRSRTGRTGQLGDIVGTIQGEQDEIIRAPMPGVMVVQGGPGTGKTVVALHRAAYLLYTNRFPLEGQGVLVVGPNRLFLRYIEQVLPSLGEAGVEMAVLADLVQRVRVTGRDDQLAARAKGDLRIVNVVRRAIKDRERPLHRDLVVGVGIRKLRVHRADTVPIIREAQRRFRYHNAGRRFVANELIRLLVESHPDDVEFAAVRDQVTGTDEFKEAMLWMWPGLTPAQLLHDLYGSRQLLASAGKAFSDRDIESLYRPWHPAGDASKVVWTVDDVPVLDEAWEHLGPLTKADDTVRTYGHILVDEAQDLSPMQLRMLTRRSLNGSMTIVGDIAQSTGAWAHSDWDEVLQHLPNKKPSSRRYLTVGYRIPGPAMKLASKVLAVAAPQLDPPVAVRQDGDEPRFVATSADQLVDTVVAEAQAESVATQDGNVAVIAPNSIYESIVNGFARAGITVGHAPRDGLDQSITVVPVGLVKGLEVDSAIVVEPAAILRDEPQGTRSLYVAVTRATKRLAIVSAEPLPDFLVANETGEDGEVGADRVALEAASGEMSGPDQQSLF